MDVNKKGLALVIITMVVFVITINLTEFKTPNTNNEIERSVINVNHIYPLPQKDKSINTTITYLLFRKGSCLVTDLEGNKIEINAYTIKVNYFDIDTCMIDIANVNDRIVKNANSDTLFLQKPNGKIHVFKIMAFKE